MQDYYKGVYSPNDFRLYHHGIKGQKWGVRNGPPYPLKQTNYTFDELINNCKNKKLSDLAGSIRIKDYDKIKEDKGFLKSVNDYYMKPEGKNNCVPASMGGALKLMGFDGVKVKPNASGGKPMKLLDVVQECFPGIRDGVDYIDGKATKIGKSRNDAEEFLVKRFGDEAVGVFKFDFESTSPYVMDDKGPTGHEITFAIKDSKVDFMDFQAGVGDSVCSNYWGSIDSSKDFAVARLDNQIPNLEAISQYLEFN